MNKKNHSFTFFLLSSFLFFSYSALCVSWNSNEVYDSLPVGEAFIRVKDVMSTYDYNDSSSNNYGHILSYASSSGCSREPYGVIARWEEILNSDEKTIQKYQGACYTIARFNYNCPGDSLIVGIGSDWNPYDCKEGDCQYYDRTFQFQCAFPKDTEGHLLKTQNCTEHPYKFSEVNPEGEGKASSSRVTIDNSLTNITREKASSTLICPDNKILKGVKSWYNKENKDREFSISCCEISDGNEKVYTVDTESCEMGASSPVRGDYELSCSSSSTFIYQLESKYGSSYEDRTLALGCCNLKESSL